MTDKFRGRTLQILLDGKEVDLSRWRLYDPLVMSLGDNLIRCMVIHCHKVKREKPVPPPPPSSLFPGIDRSEGSTPTFPPLPDELKSYRPKYQDQWLEAVINRVFSIMQVHEYKRQAMLGAVT